MTNTTFINSSTGFGASSLCNLRSTTTKIPVVGILEPSTTNLALLLVGQNVSWRLTGSIKLSMPLSRDYLNWLGCTIPRLQKIEVDFMTFSMGHPICGLLIVCFKKLMTSSQNFAKSVSLEMCWLVCKFLNKSYFTELFIQDVLKNTVMLFYSDF